MASYTNSIATTGLALRTPQAATIWVGVIHGGAATYPDNFVPVSTNSTVPQPGVAPTVAQVNGGGSFSGGDWSVSYAWTNCSNVGAPDGALVNGVTPPSPPTAVTLSSNDSIHATPGTPPPGATGVVWYVGALAGNGSATRRKTLLTASFAQVTLTAHDTQGAVEETLNGTAPGALVFGRSDDEQGNYPIPIPLSTPTCAYSYYKAVTLMVPKNGIGNTNITSIAMRKVGNESSGLALYYRVVNNYVRCTGATGDPYDGNNAQTGNYPPLDLSPHTATTPNTPVGYARLPSVTTELVGGDFFTGTAGKVGPIIQLVCGITEQGTLSVSPGQVMLPSIEFYYDEA